MRWLQAGIVVAFAALLYGVFRATQEQGFAEGVSWLTSKWWGKATAIDVYIGFAFAALWMGHVEPRPLLAALLIVNLLWLGNLVTLPYLFWRTLHAESVRAALLGP